ncbi:MAG: tRNA lysidine(34) synthetase TilS [Rhodospirillales bacterium]|nr:tRNA lysidine(34) synthetase TilS [Alphaproteobacteria bacterium]MBL6947895.1 tRNA lysidine(34) synthetase TilS [Rhodospirillales bacterium]
MMPSQDASGPLTPINDATFEALMAGLGPFEKQPHVAVAVSGGADSLCLALMAGRWATAQGGRVTALSVDHGLRPESAEEANRVGAWLKPKGFGHHVLSWLGAKPASALQAAARDARYRLMGDWCRNAGVLHLLVAHTLDDQAETFLLRLGKGSGAEGLAAMTAIRETPDVRLLRPLLDVPGDVLRATLKAEGQDWIEDPSNRNSAFERVRVRKAMRDGELEPAALALSARRFGRARQSLEASASRVLARSVQLHPAGFAVLNGLEFFTAPDEIGLGALGRVVAAVGGNRYAPRLNKLEHLYEELALVFSNASSKGAEFSGRTLGGCRVLSGRGRHSKNLLICREVRGLPEPLTVEAGARVVWDRRFQIHFEGDERVAETRRHLAPLGEQGWRDILGQRPEFNSPHIPHPARVALPALFDEKGVFSAPHLDFRRDGEFPGGPGTDLDFAKIRFFPANSLSRAGFFLRNGPDILSL